MNFDFAMDTLSSALIKMRIKTSVAGTLDTGGEWALDVPGLDGFSFYHFLKGECWFYVNTWQLMKPGDCVLITGKTPFIMASDPSTKKRIKLEDIKKDAQSHRLVINGGGDGFSMGTYFKFDGHLPKILFARLPPAIFITGENEKAPFLHWTLDQIETEFFSENRGRSLMLHHLAPLILIQTLRFYLSLENTDRNWLVALSDAKLSRALEAIHIEYQRPWSLDDLAKTTDMSRSGFASHFREQVGLSPMDYLTNWRMQIACDLLEAGGHNIATIANAVGYESESSFSAAFKKIIKCRPGFYQKNFQALQLRQTPIPGIEL